MSRFGPPERVYVELDWYDGPRSGVADINGVPHRFRSIFDEEKDDYEDAFLVWPIDDESFRLEVEQWHIFVEWNERYEADRAGIETHPGHGGINARWDELTRLLRPSRTDTPSNAKKAVAQFERLEREKRYQHSGPDYILRWKVL